MFSFLEDVPPVNNLALAKSTSQSSTMMIYSASLAVDGGAQNACAQTDKVPGEVAWWMVDIGVLVKINRVVLTGRPDCCG